MIAQSRPCFRTDLVAQPIDEGGERFVDVTDPNSGKTFRFYEVEYSIACAMNGQRDLSGLAMWAQMELGLQPSSDELQTVINTLADLGYLAEEPVQIDDLTLGEAGTRESLADELPPSADVELGTAGNEGVTTEEQTFVAPSLSLGHAGNERVATSQPPELKPRSAEPSFAGLMDDDEDQVPTQIKRPGQVTGSQPAEATLRPVGGLPDADDDGPTNLPPPTPEFDDEMSVDLSDHLHLGPDAVKEAVRQSQLMQTVEATESAGNDSAPPLPQTPAVADAARTTELPDKPIHVSKPVEPVRDAAPKSRTRLLLLVLLLVLVGGAAAVYALNLFDIRAKLGLEPAAETTTPEQEETPTPTPPPEEKPELPSATLVLGEAPVAEFKAPEKGELATIVATDTEVKEGDVVAKLKGTASIDKQIAAHKLRQEHYQGKLDKAMRSKEEAEKDGNAGAARKYQSEVDEYQRKVDEKQGLVDAEEKKLEAFLFKAPAGGRVETSLKEGDSFDADAVVFSIKGEPPLQATFTVKEDYAKDAEVEIVSKADDNKRLDCKVIEVAGEKITVECASGGALSADEEVILRP